MAFLVCYGVSYKPSPFGYSFERAFWTLANNEVPLWFMQLKARYGGSYVFTMTTSLEHENQVEDLVNKLSPKANKVYHISGTQKFELPKDDIRIADVFRAVDSAKRNFTIFAWGLADTTLEDVFIKVARGAQAFNTLS